MANFVKDAETKQYNVLFKTNGSKISHDENEIVRTNEGK